MGSIGLGLWGACDLLSLNFDTFGLAVEGAGLAISLAVGGRDDGPEADNVLDVPEEDAAGIGVKVGPML